jgi:4-hydroxyphenylpyruvate dioxygenase-like putative hemolysin
VALKNLIGIDHAVVVVEDLDKAAENWKRLGFTVSPRGTHSAKMGSGNTTIMLDPDYMELLGVLVETEHNTPTRNFLASRGEGIERIAFTAVDSAAGAEEIRARGYEPVGPVDFERPVATCRRRNSESFNGRLPRRRRGCVFSPVSTRRGRRSGFRN